MPHWLIKALDESPAIPIPPYPVPCQFGCEGSVAIFSTPLGCACWPKSKVMALCLQHAIGLEADSIHVIAKWLPIDEL